jgi:hypothetical protein
MMSGLFQEFKNFIDFSLIFSGVEWIGSAAFSSFVSWF